MMTKTNQLKKAVTELVEREMKKKGFFVFETTQGNNEFDKLYRADKRQELVDLVMTIEEDNDWDMDIDAMELRKVYAGIGDALKALCKKYHVDKNTRTETINAGKKITFTENGHHRMVDMEKEIKIAIIALTIQD